MVLQMRTSTSWSRIKSGGFGDALLVRVGSLWMSQLGQGRLRRAGGWHSRSTPSSGSTRTFLQLRLVPTTDVMITAAEGLNRSRAERP
jgi:hypothetical protein